MFISGNCIPVMVLANMLMVLTATVAVKFDNGVFFTRHRHAKQSSGVRLSIYSAFQGLRTLYVALFSCLVH